MYYNFNLRPCTEEDRQLDDAELVRFVNAPEEQISIFPQTGTASASAAAASKLGRNQRPQQLQLPANVATAAAAAAAARASLADTDEVEYSPLKSYYDRVKPDMSLLANPAGDGGGPIHDMSKLSEKELKAMIPPAFNYQNSDSMVGRCRLTPPL